MKTHSYTPIPDLLPAFVRGHVKEVWAPVQQTISGKLLWHDGWKDYVESDDARSSPLSVSDVPCPFAPGDVLRILGEVVTGPGILAMQREYGRFPITTVEAIQLADMNMGHMKALSLEALFQDVKHASNSLVMARIRRWWHAQYHEPWHPDRWAWRLGLEHGDRQDRIGR